MSNISSSIVSMVYNFQLLKYLGEDGVSAYGVLMYVQFVFVAIYIGYPSAARRSSASTTARRTTRNSKTCCA